MSNQFPSDCRYTKDHEWARKVDADITIGVSSFAVEQLGDITLVNIDVKVGDKIEAHKSFGTIESVKTLSDLFAPISGTIKAVNAALIDKPELVNEDCFGEAWMITITPSNPAEFEGLLDVAAYNELVKSAAH